MPLSPEHPGGLPVTKMRLAPRPESSRAARRAVSEMCERADLGRIADDACLVASELVTNAATHAGTSIGLTLRASEEGLRIEVTDGSTAHPIVTSPDAHALGGRGLTVVDRIARVWGSEPHGGGKVVWAVIDSGGSAQHRRTSMSPKQVAGQ